MFETIIKYKNYRTTNYSSYSLPFDIFILYDFIWTAPKEGFTIRSKIEMDTPNKILLFYAFINYFLGLNGDT